MHFVQATSTSRYPKFHLNSLLPPKLENKIAVCVGPAQNYFSNVLRIVEFVELYKQLGASKFYFYKNSVSDDVDRLFKYYQKQGIVEIFNWNLTGEFLGHRFSGNDISLSS